MLPTYNSLDCIYTMLNWKHIDYIWHNDDELYVYETLASEWLIERFMRRNEDRIPYEIKHSLDHSSICKFSHCLAEAFRAGNDRSDLLIDITGDWLESHKSELTVKDINGLRPLDVFNKRNKPNRTDKPDREYNERVEQMRQLLTPNIPDTP